MTHKIRDNESICTGCDRLINDDFETKWSEGADPYCKKCYNKLPKMGKGIEGEDEQHEEPDPYR